MTNSKTTKRTLLSSVMALLLCFTMLLGTTFAWFTDSAVSGNNIIKTGNLDMKLSWRPYGADHADEWAEVTESTVLFGEDALYEPGYTEAVWLKVENLGSLAFRYDLAINVASEKQGTNKAGEKFSLSDYLDVKYMTTTSTDMESNFYTTRESLDSFAFGAAANSGVASLSDDIAVIKNGVAFSASDATNGAYSSAYVLVVISMPTTVGNEANHNGTDIPQIDFSLTALATQLAYEKDSFGDQYDKDSAYPKMPEIIKADTAEALSNAIANAQEGDIVRLTADIEVTNLKVEKAITVDLNGKTIQTNAWGGILLNNGASLKNGTVEHINAVAAIKAWNVGSIEDVTINITTATANNHITGIAVQNYGSVDTIKNVTITGASQGIEVGYSAKVDLIENATVTARTINNNQGIGLQINGGYVGKVVNSSFHGEVYGAQIHLKGVVAVGASFENCALTGGTKGLYAWDEVGKANNVEGSSLTINYDEATKSASGTISWSFEDECLPVVKINNATPTVTP